MSETRPGSLMPWSGRAAVPERAPPKQGKLKGRYFGPEEAAYLREFVAYCRAGSFRIH